MSRDAAPVERIRPRLPHAGQICGEFSPVHPSVAARVRRYAMADPLNACYGDVAEAVLDAITAEAFQ
ncbi:MAG TPA: hypothetical protein PLP01_16805 [Phycisphaerae bacterium]|nr:hypothetical protein [Phycisphaerae bacterium]